MGSQESDEIYQPKDALASGVAGALLIGTGGVVFSAIRLALQPQPIGVWGVCRQVGGSAGLFAASGGLIKFSTIAAANMREKDDAWNHGIGGFLGGAVAGLPSGRMPRVLGAGALMGITLAIIQLSGGSLAGYRNTPEVDEYERKEMLRKNRRRPLEETIAVLGEGRSIRPPGYEERRRERLKEKYGIDINPVSVNPDA